MIGFSYISASSLFALWRIHLNRDYHMHPYQLTDSKSILTNCAFSMRFMFPLGYNFLLINNVRSNTDYEEKYPYMQLFHAMSDIPLLGDPVNTFVPLLVLIFCLATYFNLYTKLLKLLNISKYDYSGIFSTNEDINNNILIGQSIVRKFKLDLVADRNLRKQFECDLGQFAIRSLFNVALKSRNNWIPVSNSSVCTEINVVVDDSEEQQRSLIFGDQFGGLLGVQKNVESQCEIELVLSDMVDENGMHNISLND